MKKSLVVFSLLMVISLMIAACGAATPAPTAVPAAQPAATEPAKVVEPTKAPEPVKAPEPTKAPEPVVAAERGTISLWHGWTGTEADTLAGLVAKFGETGVKVDLLAVPFDQLKNKFTTEASTGGGPDLLIGPKDWIGELAQAALIQPLDDLADKVGLGNLNKSAVDANRFGGKVWAFPESTEAVGLWYNKSLVTETPKSWEELLTQAATVGLGLNTQFYHSTGLLLGGGGSIFGENQVCALDKSESVTNALQFLLDAKNTANVIADSDGGKLDAAFKDGKIGFVFQGPWATGDYSAALGADKIGIVEPITLPGGAFAPFLGTKNFFLSANSTSELALEFLKFMSEADTQAVMAAIGHIPSNPNVKVDDPIIAGFLKQTGTASYFPNEPEMGAVWTPAGDMITKVIEGKMTPAEAVAEACTIINTANKK